MFSFENVLVKKLGWESKGRKENFLRFLLSFLCQIDLLKGIYSIVFLLRCLVSVYKVVSMCVSVKNNKFK